jgi:hypothetical protein
MISSNVSIEYDPYKLKQVLFRLDKNILVAHVRDMIDNLISIGILFVSNVYNKPHLSLTKMSQNNIDETIETAGHYIHNSLPEEWRAAAEKVKNLNVDDIDHVYHKYSSYHRRKGTKTTLQSWVGWYQRERKILKTVNREENTSYGKDSTRKKTNNALRGVISRILIEANTDGKRHLSRSGDGVISIAEYRRGAGK